MTIAVKIKPNNFILTVLGILIPILSISFLYAYSFMDIISFYWNSFAYALFFWSILLFIIYFITRKREIAPILLFISIFIFLIGVLILIFSPDQYSDEMVIIYQTVG